jgi:hypothetical protein
MKVLCSYIQAPVTSCVLDPNTSFYTLFSNILSLYIFFLFNVTDQVSHPCESAGKIIALCILILFPFL